MYLPLTGFKQKDKLDQELSMNTIGPKINTTVVQPLSESAKANQETQKINQHEESQEQLKETLSEERKEKVVNHFYSSDSMSTQDFMVLRAQAPEETLEILDEAISKMKENMESVAKKFLVEQNIIMDQIGEMLEGIVEMVNETSKDNIALQVLQKTLDAMDEASNKDK